jgi:hypothetical protein
MNAGFEKLYQEMLTAIEACKKNAPDRRTEIECSFQISCNYWARVEQEMMDGNFGGLNEEIRFYKTIKPLFTASISYYNFVYQAELLKPDDATMIKEFWIKESARPGRFLLEHEKYTEYYQSGRTDNDELFFLETEEERRDAKRMSYDEWLGNWLALQRYAEYINKQLALS